MVHLRAGSRGTVRISVEVKTFKNLLGIWGKWWAQSSWTLAVIQELKASSGELLLSHLFVLANSEPTAVTQHPSICPATVPFSAHRFLSSPMNTLWFWLLFSDNLSFSLFIIFQFLVKFLKDSVCLTQKNPYLDKGSMSKLLIDHKSIKLFWGHMLLPGSSQLR